MRRMLKYLLAALWIAAVVALLTTASAEPDKADCPISSEHDWKLVHEDSPTCDSGGARYWECDNCGTQITETIPELGHDYQYETQAATCTETGYTRNRCTRCGNIFDQIDVPALGHDWDGGVVTTAATCTTDGVRTYTCTRCKDTRTESIPATGHDAVGLLPISPTCTTAGKTSGTICSVCGEILKAQEDDPPLGHNWDGGNYTAPTCTTDGSSIFTCTRCGETRTEIFPAYGHAWDSGTVTKERTCTTDGVLLFTCNNCGDTRTENFPATGHNLIPIPASAATCTKAGKTEGKLCTLCGTEVEKQQDIPALGHSWDGGTVTTAATCTTAGVKTYTCSRCGDDRTEAIPATGHTAVTLPAVAATCTTGGKTEGSQCSVCGATLTAQSDVAALGHDWDEGVVTREAGYLEEGEITYTCKRDASHTKTEAIPIKELAEGYTSAMSLMRNNPPGAGNAQKLAIFRQPEGGVIDDGFELSVEAMGGIEPYSYEWRIITGSANLEAFASGADPAASSLLSHRWRLAGKVSDRITGRNATVTEAGKKLSSADFGYGSIPRDNTASYYDRSEICTPEFFVGARVGEDAPVITATSAGIYYCIVRDSAGDYVASEKVQVNDLLYIVQQPFNLNLMGQDSVTLICKAAGGMPFADGSYMYMWCNGKGGDIKTSNENWIEVSEEGEYYCLVQDNYGYPVTSDRATVYRAEPLTVTCDQNVYYLLPGEEPVTIGMTIGGGVPPYEVRWATNLGTIDTFTTEETYLTKQVSDYGTYGLAVKDSMGKFNAAPCDVEYKQLQIAQQPVDGVLPSDESKPYTISIVMAEGEAPFTYTLFKNDIDIYLAKGEGDKQHSFDIWETGTYSIHVEDAAGRWADSNFIYVDNYSFRISHIEKSGDLNAPDEVVTLTAVLDGAEEDVTYRWWWMGSMEAQVEATELPDNGPVCIATRPGHYQCLATNKDGLDSTAAEWVSYLGSEPIILRQPQSIALQYEEGKTIYPAALSVNAISSDSRTDILEYVWEYEVNGMWLPGEQGSNILDLRLSAGEVTYRCKVTDTRTGAYVISDEAHAFIELNVNIRAWYDYHWGRYDLYYDIQGGAMPYTIDFYRHQVVGIDDNGEYIYFDYLYATETVNYGQGNIVAESSDLVFRYENGQYIKEEPRAQYYYVVTDSNGQTKTSETAQDPRR